MKLTRTTIWIVVAGIVFLGILIAPNGYSAVAGSLSVVQQIEPGAYYKIEAKHSGKCLDVDDWKKNDGASVKQYDCYEGNANQLFRFVPAGEGYYKIIAKHSSKCFDVAGAEDRDHAAIQQYTCHGGDNQLFRLVRTPRGTWKIIAKFSGRCLDVVNGDTENNATVQQYACRRGDNQEWGLTLIEPPRSFIFHLTYIAFQPATNLARARQYV